MAFLSTGAGLSAGLFTLILRVALPTVLLLSGLARGAEPEPPPLEHQVKAAFLYNFAKFVEWPPARFESALTPFVIGILGEDPFGADLDQTIKGKTVEGRPILVVRLRSDGPIPPCHLIFVSNSEQKRLRTVLDSLKNTGTLTVGESDRFCPAGGMIGFKMASNKVRFEINSFASQKEGLKISSKLMTVALHVYTKIERE